LENKDSISEGICFDLRNVSYSYESSNLALRSVSLTVRRGEKLVLLGSNGCGKSTLLKVLDGLYYAAEGTAEAFGEILSEDHFRDEVFNFSFRSRVGFVFQESDAQLFMPTVKDELAFAPLQMDLTKAEVQTRVTNALKALQLEALSDRAPHQLSGGEKKKVALASLLTLAPEVWLFDEPSSGLDPRSVAWLIQFINEQALTGKTVVLATHDLALTQSIADRVYLMSEDHRIVAEGSAEKILSNHELLKQVNLI